MHRSPTLLLTITFLLAVVCAAQSPSPAAPQASPQAAPAQVQEQQPEANVPGSLPANSKASTSPAAPESTASKKNPKTSEAEAPQPPPPQVPKTEILDSSATSAALVTDGHDPILDPPPFPSGSTTLVGGIITGVDRIRNHLTVAIFGGGSWTVYFDERTHIFHNGAEVTQLALKKGDRVYVDTMLDNNNRDIFARNIRVGVVTPPADAAGQIMDVDTRNRELIVRDTINSTSVRFGVDSNTRISRGSQPATFQQLLPGSLVRVQFAPDRPNRGLAREIVILAVPGSVFTFAGTITFLDTHRNMLSVHNTADDKTYDIYYIPSRIDAAGRLAVGAQVRIVAMFEATGYAAQQITVTQMAGASAQ